MPPFNSSARRLRSIVYIIVVFFVLAFLFNSARFSSFNHKKLKIGSNGQTGKYINALENPLEFAGDNDTNLQHLTTTIVVGRKNADVVSDEWIHKSLKDITHKAIYIVDDPQAPFHLDENKGREAMVYLRYIVDHYDNLDDVTLFFHNRRKAWHNNVLFNQDAAIMINNLDRKWVVKKGYVPARCEHSPGCPSWIKWNAKKAEEELHPERSLGLFNSELWDKIFPNRNRDPSYLAEPCCSQFAASKDVIRSVPLEQYKRLVDWLGTTLDSDYATGRVMEYMWQYLFLDEDEYCPDMVECYCHAYGLCLTNVTELKLYDEYKGKIEDWKYQLDVWDKENCDSGHLTVETDTERGACKAKNPWTPKVAEYIDLTKNMEKTLPRDFGIMEA